MVVLSVKITTTELYGVAVTKPGFLPQVTGIHRVGVWPGDSAGKKKKAKVHAHVRTTFCGKSQGDGGLAGGKIIQETKTGVYVMFAVPEHVQ